VENTAADGLDKFITELNSNLKELTDMAQVLGQDCTNQYQSIQSNDSQMYRRAYVRSVFAFIEGLLYRMKRTAAHLGWPLGNLTIAEMMLLDERAFDIDEKGEVVDRPLFIKFLNNVKFSFKIYSKSVGSSFELSLGGNGWQKLREAVKVRDRLMHPKVITDLDVTDAEVEATKTAFEWFFISYGLCGHYAQKATHTKISPPSQEKFDALDATIQKLESELKNRGN
jgi:hypothetical protein